MQCKPLQSRKVGIVFVSIIRPGTFPKGTHFFLWPGPNPCKKPMKISSLLLELMSASQWKYTEYRTFGKFGIFLGQNFIQIFPKIESVFPWVRPTRT